MQQHKERDGHVLDGVLKCKARQHSRSHTCSGKREPPLWNEARLTLKIGDLCSQSFISTRGEFSLQACITLNFSALKGARSGRRLRPEMSYVARETAMFPESGQSALSNGEFSI